MPADPTIIAAAGGIGTVGGFLIRYFSTNGKNGDSSSSSAAEFRGEMRAVMKTLADNQARVIDLMGDVHSEIAHTNQMLEMMEVRGRDQERAIRKVLGE